MKKIFKSERVIPAIVDTGFILLLIAGLNIIAQSVLAYAGNLRGSEVLDAGFWELAPISLGVFIAIRLLVLGSRIIDSPTVLSRSKRRNEKEEETE